MPRTRPNACLPDAFCSVICTPCPCKSITSNRQEGVSARDPAVARAVLSRLRDAEAQLQDAEAQFSRRKGWEITMDVITRVATEIVLRALASSNCLLAHPRLVEIIHNAPRFYPSKTSACEWAFAA